MKRTPWREPLTAALAEIARYAPPPKQGVVELPELRPLREHEAAQRQALAAAGLLS